MKRIDTLSNECARSPRMTLGRALRSEFLRMRSSALAGVHIACACAAGVACGAYFSVAIWEPAFGADAYVQLLGAMMPLMAGIVCGLAFDAEREAGGMANLLAAPSRRIAIAAKALALYFMGVATLALSVYLFAAILAATGRATLDAALVAGGIAGLAAGSAPLYLASALLAVRFGRNVSIAVGAAGLMISFFAVGGLAHGLMTGELTGASPNVLGLVFFSWACRLGSLGVESAIADAGAQTAQVAQHIQFTATMDIALSALLFAALILWFAHFEERGARE